MDDEQPVSSCLGKDQAGTWPVWVFVHLLDGHLYYNIYTIYIHIQYYIASTWIMIVELTLMVNKQIQVLNADIKLMLFFFTKTINW